MTLWRRSITFMVIPSVDMPSWRMSFSLPFIVFGLAVWSGLTLWAGCVTGRHAYMGSSGRSTGSHLHYEVWHGGRPVDPAQTLDP